MDKPLLNNPEEYPNDDVLSNCLKVKKALWDEFVNNIKDKYPTLSFEWRYYKDAKSWLCKLAKKKKTICWISILDKFFNIGFYFTEKNDEDIKNLPIDQTLKDLYFNTKSIGKLKPLSVDIKTKKILKDVYKLIDYKK